MRFFVRIIAIQVLFVITFAVFVRDLVFARIGCLGVENLERDVLGRGFRLVIGENIIRGENVLAANMQFLGFFIVHQIVAFRRVLLAELAVVGGVHIREVFALEAWHGNRLHGFIVLSFSTLFALANSPLLNAGEETCEGDVVAEDEDQEKECDNDEDGKRPTDVLYEELRNEVAELSAEEGFVGTEGEEAEGDGDPCHGHDGRECGEPEWQRRFAGDQPDSV